MRTFKYISIGAAVAFATLASLPARAESIHQTEIDSAYTLIFQTSFGKAICRQILGADPHALEFHLGVSALVARRIAASCPREGRHRWIYATDPTDIRKLTLKNSHPRKYKILVSPLAFPIESWTEPFTNTTVLVTQRLPLSRERWVQILAHELAVYFDAKANPAHPDADQIADLRNLRLAAPAGMNPLIAATNPLNSHALTFVRALQVEQMIVQELIRSKKINASAAAEPMQQRFIQESCAHECLKDVILRVRATLLPLGLPLLAFAPHFRSSVSSEIPRAVNWDAETLTRAHIVLNRLPVEFLKSESTGDAVKDMKRVFYANLDQYQSAGDVAQFLAADLWAVEERPLFESRLSESSESLLEFMKQPLLSGYNVGLSSGPRVRIRTGVFE